MEEAGAPFERMESTEDGIDRVGVRGILFKDQQALLDVLKQLDRLTMELMEQLGIILEVQ